MLQGARKPRARARALRQRIHLADLHYVVHSRAALTALAENYIEPPFEDWIRVLLLYLDGLRLRRHAAETTRVARSGYRWLKTDILAVWHRGPLRADAAVFLMRALCHHRRRKNQSPQQDASALDCWTQRPSQNHRLSAPAVRSAAKGRSIRSVRRLARPWPPHRDVAMATHCAGRIAATFNTPIGGMFAIELMLPEVSARTFLPVALSTSTATFIGRLFLGSQPALLVPPSLTLGGLCGLAATSFIRGFHFAEDQFAKIADPLSAPRGRHARERHSDLGPITDSSATAWTWRSIVTKGKICGLEMARR